MPILTKTVVSTTPKPKPHNNQSNQFLNYHLHPNNANYFQIMIEILMSPIMILSINWQKWEP